MRFPVATVVLGGGPAGCAAAIGLARAGLPVAILERSCADVERSGETLPPIAKTMLHRLDLWEAFRADDHLACPGIVSVWADAQTYENDFLFSPYGHGWHLDRQRFDRT